MFSSIYTIEGTSHSNKNNKKYKEKTFSFYIIIRWTLNSDIKIKKKIRVSQTHIEAHTNLQK